MPKTIKKKAESPEAAMMNNNVVASVETPETVAPQPEAQEQESKTLKVLIPQSGIPYCSVPSANTNIAGVIGGGVYTVFNIVDSPDKTGSFYDLGRNRFVNTSCHLITFEK